MKNFIIQTSIIFWLACITVWLYRTSNVANFVGEEQAKRTKRVYDSDSQEVKIEALQQFRIDTVKELNRIVKYLKIPLRERPQVLAEIEE